MPDRDTDMPEMNLHIDGTPDVPDFVRRGDWLATEDDDFISYVLVVKVFETQEGEWDYYPGAKSWSIQYLGIGYLTGEKLSDHNCGWISHMVAVNGELVELYKLGWNETKTRTVVPNPGYEIPKSAESLIRRLNATKRDQESAPYPLQMSLFGDVSSSTI